jgi:carbon storage regulator CsrA
VLILARKRDESVHINLGGEQERIVIKVLEVDRHGHVRLGIEAPKRYRILRGELVEEVRNENRQAVADSSLVAKLDGLSWLARGRQS